MVQSKPALTIRKPGWLKTRLPGGENFRKISGVLRSSGLHTVCEEARCPNLGGCWKAGTATFMILGDVCTRSCGYCNVSTGIPKAPDPGEPLNVARAVKEMGLRYAVVTSVTRDDLEDGGASIFVQTINEIRKMNPGCRIEVLIPDLASISLESVMRAKPDVLNHNIEVVKRLFRTARPKGGYERSLELLQTAKIIDPAMVTKSGMMVGLGETREEVIETMEDLRKCGCDMLTIGQYLQPTRKHMRVKRYYHPDEFREFKELGESMGFRHVESGPLVRSSYMAGESFAAG